MKLKKSHPLRCFAFAVALLGFSAASSEAASVAITNPSFESPVTATFDGTVTGWEQGPNTGVFVAPGFGQGAAPVDGNQIAFFNASNATLRQTLAEAYAVNTDYTLSVWVSPRVPDSLNYDLDLVFYGGNDQSNEISRTTIDFSGASTDVFAQVSATATAAQINTVGAVGQSIRIAFENAHGGAPVAGVDLDLDMVEVMSTQIPEPGMLGLFGVALSSLAIRRRRA